MNINSRNMKRAEGIVKYCTDAGMAPELSMGLWNHLVRVYNRIEVLEKRAAEEQGMSALQSGEAPSQQLKAKIRLSLERIKGAALNGDKATMFSVINQTYAELSAIE